MQLAPDIYFGSMLILWSELLFKFAKLSSASVKLTVISWLSNLGDGELRLEPWLI